MLNIISSGSIQFPITPYQSEPIVSVPSKLFSDIIEVQILNHLETGTISIFPSVKRSNGKYLLIIELSHYVSRYFDLSDWKLDAFFFHWPNNINVFPHLSQISKVMNKISCDEDGDTAFNIPARKSLSILR